MRLICPNCETEYEVHENMIPAEGRDVQCSNCMKTWFQSGPSNAETENNPSVDDAPPEPQQSVPSPSIPDYDDEDDDDFLAVPPAPMAPQPPSSRIDPEALGVIQDEVSREQTARKADAGLIETQIDLGIDDTGTMDRTPPTRDSLHEATSVEEALDADRAAAKLIEDEPATKRDMLPDIEEINSTLSDAPDYDDFEEDAPEMSPLRNPKSMNRRGFRLGFGLMLLLSAALVGLFVYAPALSHSVPAITDFLSGYVNFVNMSRGWLDVSAQDLADQINKLLGAIS